jgi:hypothetical protein
MDKAITIGMVVWWVIGIAAVLGVIGAIIFVLSLFADAFKH